MQPVTQLTIKESVSQSLYYGKQEEFSYSGIKCPHTLAFSDNHDSTHKAGDHVLVYDAFFIRVTNGCKVFRELWFHVINIKTKSTLVSTLIENKLGGLSGLEKDDS